MLSVISLFTFLSPGAKKDHAIYIGVVEIIREERGTTAQLRVKVFTDDLEDALRNFSKQHVSLSAESDCQANALWIARYFETHFECTINGRQAPFDYQKCGKNSESVWLFFDLKVPEDWKSIKVRADFLMELFPTQTNVVSINDHHKKKFLRLNKKKPSGQVFYSQMGIID